MTLHRGTVKAVKAAHKAALQDPHDMLCARGGLYSKWHGKKHHGKMHAFTLAMFTLVALTGAIGLGNIAHAYQTLGQTDWSGGVGTSTTNQYASVSNIDTSNAGELRLGATLNSDWCNTAICDANWLKRKKIYITNELGIRTNYQVRMTVDYSSGMQPDFEDLRFVADTGVDMPYFVVSKTDGISAQVFVRVPTLNADLTTVSMYYQNSAAVSTASGEDTFEFFDDFNGVSLDSAKWDDQTGGSFAVSGGKLVTTGIGAGGSLSVKNDNMSRTVATTPTSAYEYSPQVQQFGAQSDCNPNSSLRYFGSKLVTNPATDQFSIGFNCNTGTGGYLAEGASNIQGNALISRPSALADLPYGASSIKYRLGLDTSGTVNKQEYSTDGITWTIFDNADVQQPGTASPFTFAFYIGSGAGTLMEIPYVYRYQTGANGRAAFGIVESEPSQGGKVGSLTSAIYDTGNTGTLYGQVHISVQNLASEVGIRVWGSDNADMSGAVTHEYCSMRPDGYNLAAVWDSDCSKPHLKRYMQYQVLMSADASNIAGFAITDVGIDYIPNDQTAPTNPTSITMSRGDGGVVVPNAGWTNLGKAAPAFAVPAQLPYYQLSGAADTGGSGVQGYCVYFGTDNTADPLTTKGAITDASPLDTGGTCPYAVTSTTLDFASIGNSAHLDSTDYIYDGNYYLRIRTLDGAGNVSSATAQHEFKLDSIPSFLFAPETPTRSVSGTTLSIDWATSLNLLGTIPSDAGEIYGGFSSYSGVRGIAYCISSLANSFAGYCLNGSPDGVWYGVNGASPISGQQLIDDPSALSLINPTLGSYNMDLSNNPGVDLNGDNSIYIVVIDNAGNFTNMQAEAFNNAGSKLVRFNNTAPSAPQNVVASPGSSATNGFSFSWDPPSDLVGQVEHVNYCWSVNVIPDAQHCTFAGEGIESLSADAYATQPGLNTMYVVAKDEAGNINYANRASVTFTANTTAPGSARNLEVIDASNKATSSWKLALSWDAPLLPGSGVEKYKIFRSQDNLTYTEIGSTTATSFVDAGLSQITYYYKIAACDNANNCDPNYSNVDSLLPTGRFTDPANIVAGPQVTNIKTRNATITWSTDRFSDSKLAYGTRSNSYFPAEAYQSAQVTGHSIELSSLSPGTTYFYRAKWTDNDGNTGQSAEMTFTTLPAPVVSDTTVSSVNLDRAGVTFTTQGATKAKIYYGKSSAFGAVSTINTSTDQSTYTTALTGLDDGSKYYFRINTVDTSGFEYDGSVMSFTTIARPRISNVRFEAVEGEPSSTQKVTWTTNVPASTELSYGVKGAKQVDVVGSADLALDHTMTVRGLLDDTDYSLVAKSRDNLGNVALSDIQIFHTALDTRPPKILDLNTEASIQGSGAEARGQIIVTWKTDEPSTSQVSYGVGADGNFTNKSAEDARLTTDHIVIISELSTSSVYSVKALAKDKGNNPTASPAQSVVVGRGSDNIFSIIFGAVQQIFGFKL